ncbi:MAG: dCTP deaminase [Chromatiales bacterium]|jgi:dCTP deaminase|nr:dCTP deaminase [Chromatiales bacterium]
MVLSDVDILRRIEDGSLLVEPPVQEEQVGSHRIDLRLGYEFQVFRQTAQPFIDVGDGTSAYAMADDLMESIVLDEGGIFYLQPGQLALGITIERLELPDDLAGELDGRSSVGRLGLFLHISAKTIDAGFRGRITLELLNGGPVPLGLHPGMRICSVGFQQLSSPTSRPYYAKATAKYHDQKLPLQSRIWKDEVA